MVLEALLDETTQRMAEVVDAQNANDPLHRLWTGHLDASLAFNATKDAGF